ncbi:MerR family transcriptional regulator [Streptomyces sp. SID4919]|uniref:MerR family transcriptional regulator n=1 Tax=Streptomyces TaxID=1883 RepID=UPI000823B487|nr:MULTISPECIES: MerR family transcriptional regulator [unclassified Streptomyces]MYY09199.1 MerR family transcriptional regulator [Streptomyces sp. SID4919]SCK41656.1 DNA-binding transcriptional regulator, MerR family [Streptomyces sp. AmelKG-E11A]
MRIGELSRRTGVPPRMLRYYEEQGLLRPARAANGYRVYDRAAEHTVRQIRGLLDSGLTTGIIARVLPFLDRPDGILMHPDCLTRETADLLRGEADRLQQRIDCLSDNRDAILAYLTAVRARQERERRPAGRRSPPSGDG